MSSPSRRNYTTNTLLIFFLIGGDFSDKIQVMKWEGETVTLNIIKTGHNCANYHWKFGWHTPNITIIIVTNGEVTLINENRFENRLHTDVETGSITIYNLTINDSGIFLAHYCMETESLKQTFNLSVHGPFVEYCKVLEGGNVTLDTGVEELHKDHNVRWTQGPDFVGKLIAQWKNFNSFIEKSFTGVLQLNPHTGSLTFIRVTKDYAGVYCVNLLWGDQQYILRQFSIEVFETVPTPHICSAQADITKHSLNDGSCHINCSVENAPELTLSWYRGEKEINQTSNPDISTNLSLPLEIQNEGIYSCVAANPVSKEATRVNSTQWCPPHATDRDPNTIQWIIGGVCGGTVMVVVLIVLVIYLCRKTNNQGAENCFNLRNMQQQTASQDTKVSEGSNDSQGLLTNN